MPVVSEDSGIVGEEAWTAEQSPVLALPGVRRLSLVGSPREEQPEGR